mgnify:CR=1 FL=1
MTGTDQENPVVSDLLFDLPEKEPGNRFPDEAEFVSLDFETTGLYPERHRIIEIGAVAFTMRGETGRFQSLVNPGEPIPPESAAIHNITDVMVSGAPLPEKIMPDLISFLGDRIIIGHNVGFDTAFLDAACAALGLPLIGNLCIDTRNLAKKVYRGQESYRLSSLKESLSLTRNDSHRALDDALTAMELFLRSLVQLPKWERMTMNELSALTHKKQR